MLSILDLSPNPTNHQIQLLTLIAQGTPTTNQTELAAPPFKAAGQSIIVNAFLSASLSSSLLAAFGAVMAKQWVLYYARGQIGTLESQGRARQRKLNGVERWQFQHVVEGLPILLQLSLVFFFIGFILYLHAINVFVSYLVTGFFLLGTVIYTFTLWVAVVDALSPFQSPLSIFIRSALLKLWSWVYRGLRAVARKLEWTRSKKEKLDGPTPSVLKALPLAGLSLGAATGVQHHTQHQTQRQQQRGRLGGRPYSIFGTPRGGSGGKEKEREADKEKAASMMITTLTTTIPLRIQTHFQDKRAAEEEMIDNQTACWILETSEHKDALLSAARNVPALRRIDGTELAISGLAFHRLLSLFKESLNASRAQHSSANLWNSPLESAIIYGRALGHAIVGSPSASDVELTSLSRGLQWPRWRPNVALCDYNELILLKCVVTAEIPRDFCVNHSKDQMPHPSSAMQIYVAAMLEPSMETKDFRVSARKVDRIALTMWLIGLGLVGGEGGVSPRIVGFTAWALAELPAMICTGKVYFANGELRKRWWTAYTRYERQYKGYRLSLTTFRNQRG